MWIVFALIGAFLAAVAVVLTKAGVKDIESTLALALQSILILVISWGAATFQKQLPTIANIDKRTWLFLAGAGIATCLSSLFTYRALKLGEASLVSSVERLSLVLAVILAVVFLKEKINWQVIVGIILMVGGAILIGVSREGN
ncbi:MAG TPA: EamA family transporter [Segetibacter sp.]